MDGKIFDRLIIPVKTGLKTSSIVVYMTALCISCGANSRQKAVEDLAFLAESESAAPGDVMTSASLGDFDADSAYAYLARQIDFGSRVPNTEAHRLTGDWLVEEMRRHGAKVYEQKTQLKAFDGTLLNVRNIFSQINPETKDRILLLAHWDSRPWADKDPDPQNRLKPVPGANDGASGVAVLLEIARQLQVNPVDKGIDILFVDAEDWGTDGDEESWALGTQYFVENLPYQGYAPKGAILLDMVGGEGAVFCREYFSERANPTLAEEIWQTAARLGYGKMFANRMGSAILDDHVQLIKAGIPAIDIIEYHPQDETGFNPRWHTVSDNMDGISKSTLKAVGNTVLTYLRNS